MKSGFLHSWMPMDCGHQDKCKRENSLLWVIPTFHLVPDPELHSQGGKKRKNIKLDQRNSLYFWSFVCV